MSNNILDWDKLSMKQRAAYIRLGVANGYRDIDSIKLVYNEYTKKSDANRFQDGGVINWPALGTVKFNTYPDSTFVEDPIEGRGYTSTITPNLVKALWGDDINEYEANRIVYPGALGKYMNSKGHLVNPSFGNNSIIYNPNHANRDAISLDALHIMHDNPVYEDLYNDYIESAKNNAAIYETASDEFGILGTEVLNKYYSGKPLSNEELEIIKPIFDGFLRRLFAPDYMRGIKGGYDAPVDLSNTILGTKVDAIRNYLESYLLPEVEVTAPSKYSLGGLLITEANKFAGGGEMDEEDSAYLEALQTAKHEAEPYVTPANSTKVVKDIQVPTLVLPPVTPEQEAMYRRWYNFPSIVRGREGEIGYEKPKRIRSNNSSTKHESEWIEDTVAKGIIFEKSDPVYDIPFDPTKAILLGGSTTSTNVLDSLAKYAAIHNADPKLADKPILKKDKYKKPRPINKNEMLGLSYLETRNGAWPLGNIYNDVWYTPKGLANSNYFTAYDYIPANKLVRDFHYNVLSDEEREATPPLLDAFRFYAEGDYNRGDPNHTHDVNKAGEEAWKNKAVQNWWKLSGDSIYNYWFDKTKKSNIYAKGGSTQKQTFLDTLELALVENAYYDTPLWRQFLTDLAERESSYRPNITNSIGAKGYFQLMPSNRSEVWTTPTLLFSEMFRLTDSNLKYINTHMTDLDWERAKLYGIDIYGLVAGAHLGGAKNALKALRGTSNAKDMNNTSIMDYMIRFSLSPKSSPKTGHDDISQTFPIILTLQSMYPKSEVVFPLETVLDLGQNVIDILAAYPQIDNNISYQSNSFESLEPPLDIWDIMGELGQNTSMQPIYEPKQFSSVLELLERMGYQDSLNSLLDLLEALNYIRNKK